MMKNGLRKSSHVSLLTTLSLEDEHLLWGGREASSISQVGGRSNKGSTNNLQREELMKKCGPASWP